MWKPYYGDPTLTVRLPVWQHSALKTVAQRRDTTVSALLQSMVRNLLREEGLSTPHETTKPTATE